MESVAGEKMRFGGVGSKLKATPFFLTPLRDPEVMAASVLDMAGVESTGMLAKSRLDFSLNLQGDFKDVEDKKHRAVYETLADSDQKLQYYSARQIGCRLLGSRGYLCQKDFLRQNNTGKLLWQVFGIQAASLCLFGIQEHEDIMWDAFQRSGKEKVSFLYPNKSATPKSVNDLKFDDFTMNAGLQEGKAEGMILCIPHLAYCTPISLCPVPPEKSLLLY
uniref:Uncharacterized protein n=1 Tax=Aegilops tauschii TaxID=37682 RepID=R7VZU5_AEGTA